MEVKQLMFRVDGKPQSKGRPRFTRRGNYITTYTPKQTHDYEELVKFMAVEQCNDALDKEYVGPVKVAIWAYFEPNKSVSKKKRNELIGTPYLKKSDADNIAKIICDSLNGVAYKDDNQIYDLKVYKWYAEEERVEVLIQYEK